MWTRAVALAAALFAGGSMLPADARAQDPQQALQEGPVLISRIDVVGNARVDDATMLREIAIQPGDSVLYPDIERAIHLIEAQQLRELQRVDERADQLSMFATLFDDPGRINTELARLRSVTTEDVRRFADRFLVAENRAVIHYVPRRGGVA
jgi:outer membrane protein assembly factor BamA